MIDCLEVDKQKVVCVLASFYHRWENILSNKYTHTHLSQTSCDDNCPPSKSFPFYFQGTVIENSCALWSLIKVIKIPNEHEWRCHPNIWFYCLNGFKSKIFLLGTIVQIFLRLHQKARKGSRLVSIDTATPAVPSIWLFSLYFSCSVWWDNFCLIFLFHVFVISMDFVKLLTSPCIFIYWRNLVFWGCILFFRKSFPHPSID